MESRFLVKDQTTHNWSISGIIGIVGDVEGILVIRLSDNFALRLLKETGMSSEDKEEENEIKRGINC